MLFVVTLALFACNNSIDKTTNKQENSFECNSLTDKKKILSIADSIIDKNDNKQIWNLSEVDTTEFFSIEDYFANTKNKNRIVLVGGSAGMSSGTANNLLILFACLDTLKVIWAGQVGDIDQSDIRDVNNDGVKEIICHSSTMWMGECNDSYEIFNFNSGKQNFLFSAQSTSVIDCGRDNLSEFKRGDTLEHKFDCSILKVNDKEYAVKQIQTAKIHNGGISDEEILKNLKLSIDTAIIKLR